MRNSKNNKPHIYPVILCGGAGTRLWPVSRADLPKQFIPLVTKRTMLQDTAMLVADRKLYAPPVYMTGEDFQFLVERQISEVKQDIGKVILEPVRRNTAPAIALAALTLFAQDPEAIMLVMPSDHVLQSRRHFHLAVLNALRAVQHGFLVTFGMKADCAETGYGYIRQGQSLDGIGSSYRVQNFVEKPNQERAEKYVADGGYHWNSGMFVFKARQFLAELAKTNPEIIDACQVALREGRHSGRTVRPNADAFAAAEDVSVDYAVMEHTQHAAMVKGDFGWSDVGSWSAIASLDPNDDAPVSSNEEKIILKDCSNTYVRSEGGRVIAAIGLEDHVVVDTKDALLIAPKNRSQDVKAIVDDLRSRHQDAADQHALVRRPWGTYEGIHNGSMHQVKHIMVEPGGRLSTQYHHHRAEHWIVVSGVADVTVGDEQKTLKANDSVYIPLGAVHRLENHDAEPLHLIEVQYGDYLGEDDIVRIDDIYGRVQPAPEVESVLPVAAE